MKVVILCGGQGTRIRDVAENIPKPLVPVGDFPILWHIMKGYAAAGFKDFILCLGYKGHAIKDFFLNYRARMGDCTLSLGNLGAIEYHDEFAESDWTITLAETGQDTLTGSRLGRIRHYLGDAEDFMVTYGDGVGDVNLLRLLEFHKSHGRIMTLTGVHPPGRFGEIDHDEAGHILEFNEKPQAVGGRISGGFFVCNRRLFDYLDPGANQMLEEAPMRALARDGEMMMYEHDGFWQCMDTYRDWKLLNGLWEGGAPPWKTW